MGKAIEHQRLLLPESWVWVPCDQLPLAPVAYPTTLDCIPSNREPKQSLLLLNCFYQVVVMVMRRVTNTETFVKPCTEHLSCKTRKDEKMASPLKTQVHFREAWWIMAETKNGKEDRPRHAYAVQAAWELSRKLRGIGRQQSSSKVSFPRKTKSGRHLVWGQWA